MFFLCYVGSWGPNGPRWQQEPPRATKDPPKTHQRPTKDPTKRSQRASKTHKKQRFLVYFRTTLCSLVIKMSKIGSQLGPQHGGNELTFSTLEPSWLHLGANLPPKWPQDPPRSHLGVILGPFWCHFGAILGPSWLEKCAHLASKFFSQVN